MKTKSLTKTIVFSLLCVILTSAVSLSQDTYKVKRVIDGDTIEIENGERVRLIGIDTPETVHPSKPVQYFGKEASNFTKNLVEGKLVKIEYDVQKRDKYNRLLAYIYLEDGTFVNAELVKQGYAHVSTYPPNVKYVELFAKLQTEARENNRGLWAEQQVSVKPQIAEKPSSTDTVYTTRTGTKYHRAGCRYLSKSMIPISLEDAVKSYGACGVCNPPILQEEAISAKPIQSKENILLNTVQPPKIRIEIAVVIGTLLGVIISMIGNLFVNRYLMSRQSKIDIRKLFFNRRIDTYLEFSGMLWEGYTVNIKQTERDKGEASPLSWKGIC